MTINEAIYYIKTNSNLSEQDILNMNLDSLIIWCKINLNKKLIITLE